MKCSRRVSMYISWSYPAEAGRELYELNNRYSAMWEVRRVAYPKYEEMAGNPQTFMQGIDGTLELFLSQHIRSHTLNV